MLVRWANEAPGLKPAHRTSYLAWHCDGRGVLRIQRTRTGLAVVAGVDATKPSEILPEPVHLELATALTPLQFHGAVSAVSAAAVKRLQGIDAANAEHRLQSMLEPRDVGLLVWDREFPAWRPSGRAFIDFLGVDGHGVVHVVETKIGPDEMLVLQGLDYWIWATAHAGDLQEHFGLEHRPRVAIDFVVAGKMPGDAAIGVYTAAQAEALAGEISWRFHPVRGWPDAEAPKPYRLPARTLPVPTPRCRGYRASLGHPPAGQRCRACRGGRRGARGPDALRRCARRPRGRRDSVYDRLTASGLTHHQVSHLRSSQAFAMNLLAPLDEQARRELFGVDGAEGGGHVEPLMFEYVDPADTLAEATLVSPHTTQVDALVPATDRLGDVHVTLIEVKLSEDDFGACSAYQSSRNGRRKLCRQPHPFGGDPAHCFQLANHDREHRRRYDQFLGRLKGTPSGAGCSFRGGANQVMRNVALAGVLLERGETATVTFALCAPAGHRVIWRRWHEYTALFDGLHGVSFRDLPAETVLQHHPIDEALALADRYLLDERAAEQRHACAALQPRLDALFPRRSALRRA